jgi:hypothetical protein
MDGLDRWIVRVVAGDGVDPRAQSVCLIVRPVANTVA